MSEFESADYSSTEPGKVEREGLPPGYRMRADAHYVDALSGSPRGERAREAGRAVVADDPVRQATQDRRVFEQLAEDVSAIESAAALLTGERSSLLRRVGLDLIKAQSARAAWLLRATALGNSVEADAQPRRRPIGEVLAMLRDRASVECRLLGVGLEIEATGDAASAVLPETMLSAGLTGAILAQLGLVEGVEHAIIRVRVGGAPGDISAISIDVGQEVAPVPAGSHARFFDAGWTTRPGGWLSAMGAATARLAAERMGGAVALVTAERRGCTIRFTLP